MSNTVGYYWKLIRYYVSVKRLVGLAFFTLIFILVATAEIRTGGGYASEKTTTGVVLSSGPVDVSRVCGGIQQFATVQLADGAVVQAYVGSSLPIKDGSVVYVKADVSQCNGVGYIVQTDGSGRTIANKGGIISPPPQK